MSSGTDVNVSVVPVADPAALARGLSSRKDLIVDAKAHQQKNACTVWDEEAKIHKWRPIVGTKRNELAEYGVGVRLYFDFLFQMGILFLLLIIVTLPLLYFNHQGNMLDESNVVYQSLGKFSIANLGSCSDAGGQCRSQHAMLERLAFAGSTQKLSEITKYLGLLDAVAVVIFLVFGMYFHRIWIPYVVQQADKQHVTAADFSVEVTGLPIQLAENHEKYESRVREHFNKLLKDEGVEEDAPVREVTLVRDYSGAINKFMNQGQVMSDIDEQEARLAQAQVDGNKKKIDKIQKAKDKLQKRADDTEVSLKEQGHMTDDQRDVCTAFVVFNREQYKDQIMHLYRFARTRCFRSCQAQSLRFDKRRIRVQQACEPTDLYWENLDFGYWRRFGRGCMTLLIAIVILLVCIVCLVSAQSLKQTEVQVEPARAWVIMRSNRSDSNSCLRLCEWQLFKSQYCYTDQANSASWSVAKVFDALGSSDNQSSTNPTDSARFSVVNGNSSCAAQWTSPACSNSASKQRDWIGIEFSADHSVNQDVQCSTLHQPLTEASDEVEIYACHKNSLPAAGAYSTWRPEEACMQMQAVQPLNSNSASNPPSAYSGSLAIKRDTSCGVPATFEFAQTLLSRGADAANDPSVTCFCKQQLSAVGYSFRLPPYNTPESLLCQQWSSAENKKVGLMVASVFAVLVLNQVLFFVFRYLVDRVHFRKMSDLTKNEMTMLFIVLFVNTGILVLCVNWALLGDLPLDLLNWIFKGTYRDFDRSFFPSVGSSLCITIGMLIFSVNSPYIVMALIVNPILAHWSSRGTVTESKMQKVFELPQWSLSRRLAEAMNVIFCVVMYAGGMPGLYLVGFIYCFVGYWTDKYVLLRGSSKPPSYNEDVVGSALGMFPGAAFLHTVVSLFIFGKQNLFPSEWSNLTWIVELLFSMTREESVGIIGAYDPKLDSYTAYLQARSVGLAREGCVLLSLIFLGFAGLQIAISIWTWFLRLFCFPLEVCVTECIKGCCKKRDRAEKTTFEDAKAEMEKKRIITSYRMASCPRYVEAAQAVEYIGEKSCRSQAATYALC